MAQRGRFPWLSRLCIALIILTLIVPSLPPVAPAHAAGNLNDLVRAYEASLGKSAEAQRDAALALFQRYGEYKKLVVQGGQVSPATARALDEHLVGMTQQIWRDVSVRHGRLRSTLTVKGE